MLEEKAPTKTTARFSMTVSMPARKKAILTVNQIDGGNMKQSKKPFYTPETDPDGSYTGTRKEEYGDEILPGLENPEAEVPVQDADDL